MVSTSNWIKSLRTNIIMKTAIIVRGNARTWNYLKQHNIELFNEIYDYPDWYVAFPDTGTVTRESLLEDFQGSNLRSIQLIPDDHYPWNYSLNPCGSGQFSHNDYHNWKFRTPAYWRQAWLDYMAGIAKRKYELENNIRYTNVLGFRPDNWFNVPDYDYVHMRSELDTMAVSNTNFGFDLLFNDWRTPDFVWRAGATASDIFCMRFLDSYLTEGISNQLIHWGEHSVPCYYQARSFIDGRNTSGHVVCEIVTPNAPFPWTKDSYTDNYYKVRWHELSLEERYQHCIDLKISPRDYQVDLSVND